MVSRKILIILSDSRNISGKKPSAGQVKNVRESIDAIVRGLHLLNGGGSVALLAFLGTTWSHQKELRQPILIALSILAAGEMIVGVSTFLRMKWLLSKLGSETRDYNPPWYYVCSLVVVFLCFVVAIVILIVWLFHLPGIRGNTLITP